MLFLSWLKCFLECGWGVMEVNRQYEEDRAIFIPLTIVTDFECAKVI
jgi:hypothetical protein